jgi:hypothetical protein
MCSWTHLLDALYAPAARFTSPQLKLLARSYLSLGPAPHPLPLCLPPNGRRLTGLRCSHGQYEPGLLSVPVSFPADCITVVESRAGLTLEYATGWYCWELASSRIVGLAGLQEKNNNCLFMR